ncbi:hypothetical protein BM1_07365 [Bipolaris maydis]|nr:hypothetical protein BM1_07365 [Bipolaris maydis]
MPHPLAVSIEDKAIYSTLLVSSDVNFVHKIWVRADYRNGSKKPAVSSLALFKVRAREAIEDKLRVFKDPVDAMD